MRDNRLYYLPKSVQDYYKSINKWDDIIKCNAFYYKDSHILTVKLTTQNDRWRWENGGWFLTNEY